MKATFKLNQTTIISYYSNLKLENSPTNGKTLYGVFSTDGGANDMQNYRDGDPKNDWGGFSWYVLNKKESDAGNEDTEVARMFLKALQPQKNKKVRTYQMALGIADKNGEYSSGFGSDLVTCTVQKK